MIDSQLIDTINSPINSDEPPSIILTDTINSQLSTQSTLALKTAYDKNIHLPYQMNFVALRKAQHYVVLFCKGKRHQNILICKVYLML